MVPIPKRSNTQVSVSLQQNKLFTPSPNSNLKKKPLGQIGQSSTLSGGNLKMSNNDQNSSRGKGFSPVAPN